MNGWLVLDKPVGITSAAVLNRIKRWYRPSKIGHVGTLDRLASGMLPIAIGEATKVAGLVISHRKRYEFTVSWGEQRDTDDAEGAVLASSDARPDEAAILAAIAGKLGVQLQIPPDFSAIKQQGKRASDRKRDGEIVIIPPREITIYTLVLTAHDGASSSFAMYCSKGTYVRSVARDLGLQLGCYGYVSKLRRTQVEPFELNRMIPLDRLDPTMLEAASLPLLPIVSPLDDILAFKVDSEVGAKLRLGQKVPFQTDQAIDPETVLLIQQLTDQSPIALAKLVNGCLAPQRVFNLNKG